MYSKRSILYAKLRDINKTRGTTEFVFREIKTFNNFETVNFFNRSILQVVILIILLQKMVDNNLFCYNNVLFIVFLCIYNTVIHFNLKEVN